MMASPAGAEVASLLTPFERDRDLGDWPPLLWARDGLDALSVEPGGRP